MPIEGEEGIVIIVLAFFGTQRHGQARWYYISDFGVKSSTLLFFSLNSVMVV